jgi:predicted phosphodiesterase
MRPKGQRITSVKNHAEFFQNAPNVHTVAFTGTRAGWEQYVLLTSDRHHDSNKSLHDLERKHLDMAAERDALIIDAGDTLDVMQSKDDKRQSKSDIRSEDVNAAYLDSIVNNAAKFYSPYAARWLIMGRGNHDTNIINRYGTDLIDRLAEKMRLTPNGLTVAGGYGGWVRFMFERSAGGGRRSFLLKYFHGTGGGGLMTHGTLDTRRQGSYLPDADIVLNGHTHGAYHVPLARERLTSDGNVSRDLVHYIRTPGYKDEYRDGSGGWAIERGHPPKPVGCAWLHFYVESGLVKLRVEMDVE